MGRFCQEVKSGEALFYGMGTRNGREELRAKGLQAKARAGDAIFQRNLQAVGGAALRIELQRCLFKCFERDAGSFQQLEKTVQKFGRENGGRAAAQVQGFHLGKGAWCCRGRDCRGISGGRAVSGGETVNFLLQQVQVLHIEPFWGLYCGEIAVIADFLAERNVNVEA